MSKRKKKLNYRKMEFIITFTDGETQTFTMENRNTYFNLKLVESLQAEGPAIQIVAQLFTPANPLGCTNLTIPFSIHNKQRWYGDIAKTIIYALLQEYDKTTNRRRT